jgi:hypothetical protein
MIGIEEGRLSRNILQQNRKLKYHTYTAYKFVRCILIDLDKYIANEPYNEAMGEDH